jgi:hypothetical protein
LTRFWLALLLRSAFSRSIGRLTTQSAVRRQRTLAAQRTVRTTFCMCHFGGTLNAKQAGELALSGLLLNFFKGSGTLPLLGYSAAGASAAAGAPLAAAASANSLRTARRDIFTRPFSSMPMPLGRYGVTHFDDVFNVLDAEVSQFTDVDQAVFAREDAHEDSEAFASKIRGLDISVNRLESLPFLGMTILPADAKVAQLEWTEFVGDETLLP